MKSKCKQEDFVSSSLLNGNWQLIQSPRHVRSKALHQVNSFVGDEYDLKWGSLLIGEPEDGNISYEIAHSSKPGSLQEMNIIAPEGKYVFVKSKD
jgi:hypothetical protein